MKKSWSSQAGFSTLFVYLIIALVVLGIGAIGYRVYHSDTTNKNVSSTVSNPPPISKQTTQKNSVSSQQQQSTTDTLSTYTASSGGFTFSYPSTWKVNNQQNVEVGSVEDVNINSTTALTSNVDAFRMTIWVANNPDFSYQPAAAPNGTIQSLSNGLNIWTTTSTDADIDGTYCPVMELINSSKTHFSYQLQNGKYLTMQAGYCQAEKDTTSQTFQEEISSHDWQSGIAIIQSIKFQ